MQKEDAHEGVAPAETAQGEITSAEGAPEPIAREEIARRMAQRVSHRRSRSLPPYADPPPRGFDGVYQGTPRYTRTGIVLHAASGPAFLHIFRTSEANIGGSVESGVSAFRGSSTITTTPFEIEFGGGAALRRDLALLLLLRSSSASSANLETPDGDRSLDGGLTMSFFGLGLIAYPNPAQGWSFEGAAGFESWRARVSGEGLDQIGGNGVSLSLRGGYHFWIGPELALGLVLRADGGLTTGDAEAEIGQIRVRGTENDVFIKGGLFATVRYF